MVKKVLIYPYRIQNGQVLYFIGQRPKSLIWQPPTGTVEKDESFAEAAKRELEEELGVSDFKNFINTGKFFSWQRNGQGVREAVFAIELAQSRVKLDKKEFRAGRFLKKEAAGKILYWADHKRFLGEVNKAIGSKEFPRILIVCGAGGAGKETVIAGTSKKLEIQRAKTYTTRPKRAKNEGVARVFLSEEEFVAMKRKGLFIETNYFKENWYGSAKEDVEKPIMGGKSILIELDINGVKSFKKKFSNVTSIFLHVNSAELEKRMRGRQADNEETIAKRIEIAKVELQNAKICDYIVENKEGKVEETINTIAEIIKKEGGGVKDG